MAEDGSVAVWSGIVPEAHPGPHVSPESLPAQGVASPQEGGGERGGSVDPTGSHASCVSPTYVYSSMACILLSKYTCKDTCIDASSTTTVTLGCISGKITLTDDARACKNKHVCKGCVCAKHLTEFVYAYRHAQ